MSRMGNVTSTTEVERLRAENEALRAELNQRNRFFNDMSIGVWTVEKVDGKPPQMWGDPVMDEMVGVAGQNLSPEKYFETWFSGIHPDDREMVVKAVAEMDAGLRREVQYRVNHPTRGEIWIRCGCQRDESFVGGVRQVGRHQDVTKLVREEQQSISIMSALGREYRTLWLVDKLSRSMRLIRSSDESTVTDNVAKALRIGNYDEMHAWHVEKCVLAEDRARVAHAAACETVLAEIAKMPLYTVNYRRCDNGREIAHHQMAYADAGDHFVLAFRDIQAMVSQELEEQRKLEELKMARQLAELEQDRADKYQRINESLEVLVKETDFPRALERIMKMWSEALGAQWCHLGKFEGDYCSIVHYYAADGFKPILAKGCLYPRLRKAFDEKYIGSEADDYQAFPDCKDSPYTLGLVDLSPNPDSARAISSSYSHIIRLNGVVWGQLGLKFREKHELTMNEERFFKATAKSIELALLRQDYQETLEREHAEAIAVEEDRIEKERRVNETLEVLVAATDIPLALRQIMSMWCEALGAQWCFLGHYTGDDYEIVQSHAAPNEYQVVEPGCVIKGLGAYESRNLATARDDFMAMPDCHGSPVADAFAAASSHPEAARAVHSCYSHDIRYDNAIWGTLVLLFRDRHVMTANEERFFRASAKGVQLALIRQAYRKGLEQERDRALAAEKSKSLFFSSVSHDIRTPLNAIIGFSELLEQGVVDRAEHDRYVSTIRSSGKMLARLVNDVLDLSKLESGRLELINEPTNVAAVAREIAESFGVTHSQKSVIFQTDIAEMPRVDVDPQRIRQFLYNLLSNAFKYTDRGTITLRTEWNDGTLKMSVADTGKGISAENRNRILQPFVQLADRNHRDGTGLGLSICQRLAKLMGGYLTVESEVGKGSVFTVTLEGVKVSEHRKGQTQNIVAPSPVAPVPAASKISRLLIVDDSKVNLAVLKAMLMKNGISEVKTAENGCKALEVLAGDSKFDAILTDFWMPEMDGLGLVQAIRADANLAHIPVYLITADVEAVRSPDSVGFTGVLLKPITGDVIRKLLGSFS